MTGGVPYLTFDSEEVPAGEARARWAALIGAYDVDLPEGEAEEEFAVSSESWLVGDLLVTHGRLTPVELHRSRSRIENDGRDSFTFGLVTRGHLAGDFDGRACDLRPGQVCAIDFARPWRADAGPTEFILVAAPRAAVSAMGPHPVDLHGRRLDGATARILVEHFVALVRHLPEARAEDAAVIRRSTLRMIAESLASLPPAEPLADGRVAYRARRHIEANLGSAALTPAAIGEALGVSRATLYRAFRGSGGLANYIQRRRLEAAHMLLSDPRETRSLAELSLAYCFSSHAHFSTAFRRRFGYSPRDARDGTPLGGAGPEFRSWVLSLAGGGA
ncbi:helix-turn-helix domain-containing protein [Phenylobacterium sp.]|uniref:helix-turn-helix domain-containing protein n=1 Tax=Phenylobacterium sp. TaxID=1871053 RepID=UPI0025EF9B07|nr:helix-turn-helix domain-containing protein [Phenylobacterium sp.]